MNYLKRYSIQSHVFSCYLCTCRRVCSLFIVALLAYVTRYEFIELQNGTKCNELNGECNRWMRYALTNKSWYIFYTYTHYRLWLSKDWSIYFFSIILSINFYCYMCIDGIYYGWPFYTTEYSTSEYRIRFVKAKNKDKWKNWKGITAF